MQVLSKEKTGEFSKLWGLSIKTNFKRGLKNFKFQQNLVFGWPGRKKNNFVQLLPKMKNGSDNSAQKVFFLYKKCCKTISQYLI